MSIALLAISSRTILIVMLIILIVVALVFGFMVYMILNARKRQQVAISSKNVMYLLEKHEQQLVAEIEKGNPTEEKKTELMNKLRRAKSAQLLVEELVKEHEAAASGAAQSAQKPAAQPAQKPAQPAAQPAQPAAQPAQSPAQPAAQPVQKPAQPAANPAKSAANPTANPAAKPAQNPADKK